MGFGMVCEEVISQREKDQLVAKVDDMFGLKETFPSSLTHDETYNYFTRCCNIFKFWLDGDIVAVVFLDVDGSEADIHVAKFKPCDTKKGLKALWDLVGHQIKTFYSYIPLDRAYITRFWRSLGFIVEMKEDGYYATLHK